MIRRFYGAFIILSNFLDHLKDLVQLLHVALSGCPITILIIYGPRLNTGFQILRSILGAILVLSCLQFVFYHIQLIDEDVHFVATKDLSKLLGNHLLKSLIRVSFNLIHLCHGSSLRKSLRKAISITDTKSILKCLGFILLKIVGFLRLPSC